MVIYDKHKKGEEIKYTVWMLGHHQVSQDHGLHSIRISISNHYRKKSMFTKIKAEPLKIS